MGEIECIRNCCYHSYCKTKHPKGFKENKVAVKQGGAIAGNERKALEIKIGEKIVTAKNYLPANKQHKQLK